MCGLKDGDDAMITEHGGRDDSVITNVEREVRGRGVEDFGAMIMTRFIAIEFVCCCLFRFLHQ